MTHFNKSISNFMDAGARGDAEYTPSFMNAAWGGQMPTRRGWAPSLARPSQDGWNGLLKASR